MIMTENKRFLIDDAGELIDLKNHKFIDYGDECCKLLNELSDENEQLKSTIAQLIEQNRKNKDLLLSDIRILEKALWCSGCENDYGRLKELRKEFMKVMCE